MIDVIDRRRFRKLRRQGLSPDPALDASTRGVTLAEYQALKASGQPLSRDDPPHVPKVENVSLVRLMTDRTALITYGLLIPMLQVIPPGKGYRLIVSWIHHAAP